MVLISLLCLGSSAQNRVEVLAGDLRFSKLSLEDSGMYQCVAENKHGTIYASAELAVQGKGSRRQGTALEHEGCVWLGLSFCFSKHTLARTCANIHIYILFCFSMAPE